MQIELKIALDRMKQMYFKSYLDLAIAIATLAHAEQLDKQNVPYILHPLRVMCKAKSEESRIAAVLHDVIEDTDVTIAYLLDLGFSPRITQALDHLTRREKETYKQFIDRVALDRLATEVKLLDLEDNMDPTREWKDQKDLIEKRYKPAQIKLLAAQIGINK